MFTNTNRHKTPFFLTTPSYPPDPPIAPPPSLLQRLRLSPSPTHKHYRKIRNAVPPSPDWLGDHSKLWLYNLLIEVGVSDHKTLYRNTGKYVNYKFNCTGEELYELREEDWVRIVYDRELARMVYKYLKKFNGGKTPGRKAYLVVGRDPDRPDAMYECYTYEGAPLFWMFRWVPFVDRVFSPCYF